MPHQSKWCSCLSRHSQSYKGLRSSMPHTRSKDHCHNKRCSCHPITQESTRVLGSLCQELGRRTEYVFLVISQDPTLIDCSLRADRPQRGEEGLAPWLLRAFPGHSPARCPALGTRPHASVLLSIRCPPSMHSSL